MADFVSSATDQCMYSFCSHCCNQIPDKNQFKVGRIYADEVQVDHSIMVGKARSRSRREPVILHLHSRREELTGMGSDDKPSRAPP